MSDLIHPTFDKRDDFKRRGIAEKLLHLLESTDVDASPILLDGPWGTGKTEFCLKLSHLSKDITPKLKCVYIDAFKFDHADDPLLMLISGVSSAIENANQKKDLIKKAIPVLKVIGKVTAKAAVNWTLKENATNLAEEVTVAIKSSSDELIAMGIEKLVQNLEDLEESLNVFRTALNQASRDHNILIIIDELDRCRPTFALAVLEKVKHVFEVDGIKFLFSTNISQLCSIVRKQYGSEIDAETYLGKFFNFTVRLPVDHAPENSQFLQNSFIHLFKQLTTSDYKAIAQPDSNIMLFLKLLIGNDRRSLRDVDMYCRNLKIYNLIASQDGLKTSSWQFIGLRMFALYVYTFNPELTRQILEENLTTDSVSNFFQRKVESLSSIENDFGSLIYATLILELDKTPAQLTPEIVAAWRKEIYHNFVGNYGPENTGRIKYIRNVIRKVQLV